MKISQEEFLARLVAEFTRLGISEHEARFLGFGGGFYSEFFDELVKLPDGAGARGFYRHIGGDYDQAERDEADLLANPPHD
jgi:hypothetical protein